MADQADLSDVFKDTGSLSIEKLKKELMKATEEREAALSEVSEMRSSLGELKQKLEFLESYCRELKKALSAETKDPQKVKNLSKRRENDRPLDEPNGDSLMPVSEEVMVEGFLQIVSEARLSVNQFCKCLVAQIEETDDETLIDNLNMLLQPYKVSLHSKSSKSVLYHLEAIINQTLYQDFENPVFQKNGAPKHLDPLYDRQAQFSSYVALRNLSWNDVLRKGTKYYSEEFSKFCDQKMSCIISMLNWNRPWPEQLLQVFFVAAKCIWLLHLLAFSFDPPLTIMRVEENAGFDPQYMEDMSVDRHRSHTDGSRVRVMVMPGFYVSDRVLRCKVIAKCNAMS
uniref:GIL1/IRKI C-terminal domain-containing protein n=1 Tax=Kalanchoe fedtschenkoi TaxID=63787 RepID=A0A7N0VHE7_KALFE